MAYLSQRLKQNRLETSWFKKAKQSVTNKALSFAILIKSTKLAYFSLNHGAQINKQDKNGNTALHLAALNQDSTMVRGLLWLGADPTIENSKNHCAHDYAYHSGNIENFAALLEVEGANDDEIPPPMALAVIDNNLNLLQHVLEYSDINEQDKNGYTALHSAATLTNPVMVQALLWAGADHKVKNNKGHDAGGTALNSNSIESFATILDMLTNNSQTTTLILATQLNNLSLLQHTIEYGNINEQDKNGFTALHFAAKLKDPAIAQALLLAGADPTIEDNFGSVAFQYALAEGHIETAQNMLDIYCEKSGTTTLHGAAVNNNLELLKQALEYTDINEQDEKGNTALHFASDINNLETVQALLDRGANALIRSKIDITAFDMTQHKQHDSDKVAIETLLLEAMMDEQNKKEEID